MPIEKEARDLGEEALEQLEEIGFKISDYDLDSTQGTTTGVSMTIDCYKYKGD